MHSGAGFGFARWLRQATDLKVTDTTMRDAHQSLFATRMRSFDMLAAAPHAQRVAFVRAWTLVAMERMKRATLRRAVLPHDVAADLVDVLPGALLVIDAQGRVLATARTPGCDVAPPAIGETAVDSSSPRVSSTTVCAASSARATAGCCGQ